VGLAPQLCKLSNFQTASISHFQACKTQGLHNFTASVLQAPNPSKVQAFKLAKFIFKLAKFTFKLAKFTFKLSSF